MKTIKIKLEVLPYLQDILAMHKQKMTEDGITSSYRVEILQALIERNEIGYDSILEKFKQKYAENFDTNRFEKSWGKVSGYNQITDNIKTLNEKQQEGMRAKLCEYERRKEMLTKGFLMSSKSTIREFCKFLVMQNFLKNKGIADINLLRNEIYSQCLSILKQIGENASEEAFHQGFIDAVGIVAEYNIGNEPPRQLEPMFFIG